MQRARGNVSDRPWGLTLAGLWLRKVTAQLTVHAHGEQLAIALQRGAVVGATSPRLADSAVRIAAAAGFVRTAQIVELTARIAAQPERDEIDVLAETARLRPDVALRIRRLAITHRAARTFELERGDVVLDARISIPVAASCAVDMPSIVHFGARHVVDEHRLVAQIRALGTRFLIKPNASVEIAAVPGSKIAIELLTRGCDLAELEALPAGLDRHGVFAVVYTLACSTACEIESHVTNTAPQRERTGPVPLAPQRERTGPLPVAPPREGTGPVSIAPAHSQTGGVPLASPRREPSGALPTIADGTPRRNTPGTGRPTGSVPPLRPTPPRLGTGAVPPLRRGPIAQLEERIARGVDHFGVLDIPFDASPEVARAAYVELARWLDPIEDRALLARIGDAVAVLTDFGRRAAYLATTSRTATGGAAFRRGQHALASGNFATAIDELCTAIKLDPDSADAHAMLAWARFCIATDKQAIAGPTRRALKTALAMGGSPALPTLYLAQLASALERDYEARKLLERVLQLDPDHDEARGELERVEHRIAQRGGLFDRLRRGFRRATISQRPDDKD